MQHHSDIIIIGGGLAGLTAAIHLAKFGQHVRLFEPQQYPKHKVCGEYISNEVLPYLDFLGIAIENLAPSIISELHISTQKGKSLQSTLPLGGFGISRATLDHYLYKIAKKNNAQVVKSKVISVDYVNKSFNIKDALGNSYSASYVIGAYGKQSKLDLSLQRSFTSTSPWLAVKGHYQGKWNAKEVALHNFEGGYCGISTVEQDRINVCYLAHYDSFKRYKSLPEFQEHVLCKNPHLHRFFAQATPLFERPLTISGVNFAQKKTVERGVFMIGDSAGLIHPLCGNGMAMAIQSAQILCTLLLANLERDTPKPLSALAASYTRQWDATFKKRIQAGRMLQKVLLHKGLQQGAYYMGHLVPQLVPKIIQQTHGTPIAC